MSTIPGFLDEAGLDVPCIVHEDIQNAVNTNSFLDFCIDFYLGSSDIKVKNRSTGIFGNLETFRTVSSSSYYAIASCDDGLDEVLSNSRRASSHKPGELRYFGVEVKSKNEDEQEEDGKDEGMSDGVPELARRLRRVVDHKVEVWALSLSDNPPVRTVGWWKMHSLLSSYLLCKLTALRHQKGTGAAS
ncbi:hypothetical protein MMC28_005860 [Mycoblastus sanguinarius]|nr:hypothetical protein [Mycoblastus sanguinarius]